MKDSGEKELVRLRRRVSELKVEMDGILNSEFGRRLYVSEEDGYRLLVLRSWQERYQVSLSYILTSILPTWWKILERFKRRSSGFGGSSGGGLGIRVATLVGKKSEEILREKIELNFPGHENKRLYRQERREEILGMEDDDVPVKQKGLLDFETPKDFVERYAASVGRKRMERESSEEDKERKSRPYRNSPWV